LEVVADVGLRGRLTPAMVCLLLGRLSNLTSILPSETDRAFYKHLMSPNRNPLDWLKRKQEPATAIDNRFPWEKLPDFLHRMMYQDFVTYLPDDILVKVDRAAMSISLETRIPLLDHRIIEYAWSLPSAFKQRRGRGKWLLREVLGQYVPRSLFERPKKGFNVPIAQWLRGPLHEWAEELLSGTRLRREGFFDDKAIRRKWLRHLDGSGDGGVPLWHVLMFQAWLEQQQLSRPRMEEKVVPMPATASRLELACQS
jgi:asparagine synthase (glutamine-hydrolysing)